MVRTEVTEVCPHCEEEITMIWDTESMGFHAFCPVCGKRLMLCDECQHTVCQDGEPHNCDYDKATDTCHRQKASPVAGILPTSSVEIRNIAYQMYQMWWCVNHGVTIADILAKYSEYWGEVEADSADNGFEEYLAQTGFAGGQIWACMDEFLDCEYRHPLTMAGILNICDNPRLHQLHLEYMHDLRSINAKED